MIKIVVAGYGPVGQAVEYVLAKHHAVDVFIDDSAKGFYYAIVTGKRLLPS